MRLLRRSQSLASRNDETVLPEIRKVFFLFGWFGAVVVIVVVVIIGSCRYGTLYALAEIDEQEHL